MEANPQVVEAAMLREQLQEAIESGTIPPADRGLSYWKRIGEMTDDVRAHAATRLDATFAGGVKVSVYRLNDRQVRIDIQES